jgi:hypothetical protein
MRSLIIVFINDLNVSLILKVLTQFYFVDDTNGPSYSHITPNSNRNYSNF